MQHYNFVEYTENTIIRIEKELFLISNAKIIDFKLLSEFIKKTYSKKKCYLQNFSMINCNITTIPEYFFYNMHCLNMIQLNNNKLKTIKFKLLSRIITINLTGNNLVNDKRIIILYHKHNIITNNYTTTPSMNIVRNMNFKSYRKFNWNNNNNNNNNNTFNYLLNKYLGKHVLPKKKKHLKQWLENIEWADNSEKMGIYVQNGIIHAQDKLYYMGHDVTGINPIPKKKNNEITEFTINDNKLFVLQYNGDYCVVYIIDLLTHTILKKYINFSRTYKFCVIDNIILMKNAGSLIRINIKNDKMIANN
jgi:hypothetical protein